MHIFKLNQRGFDHVLVAVACFVVVGLVGAGLLVESHAQTAPQWTGVLKVYSGNATAGAGDCLTTISGASSGSNSGSEGAYAVLQPCSKTYDSAQVWSLNDTRKINLTGTGTGAGVTIASSVQEFTLQSAAGSNECLNDWQTSTSNGTQQRLYPCSSSATASAWIFGVKLSTATETFPSHYIINLGASKISLTGAMTGSSTSVTNLHCLDDNGGSSKTDAKVDVYTCKSATQGPSNEEWFEEPAPSKSSSGSGGGSTTTTWTGALQNDNLTAKICMNDNDSSTKSNTAIGIYACENVVSEKWSIQKLSNGTFELKNGQGVCANDTGGGVGTTPVETTTCSTSNGTDLWEWEGHQLENYSSQGCINDPSSSTKDSTELHVASCSGAPGSEQWFEVGMGGSSKLNGQTVGNGSTSSGGSSSGSGTVSWTGGLENGDGEYMNDNGSSKTDGTAIGIYAKDDVTSETWSTVDSSTSGQFYLKNGEGVCADSGGAVPNVGSTEYLVTNSCSSADLFEWNGSELEDVSTPGCINDPSSSKTNGTQLRVTSPCSSAASEEWSKVTL